MERRRVRRPTATDFFQYSAAGSICKRIIKERRGVLEKPSGGKMARPFGALSPGRGSVFTGEGSLSTRFKEIPIERRIGSKNKKEPGVSSRTQKEETSGV